MFHFSFALRDFFVLEQSQNICAIRELTARWVEQNTASNLGKNTGRNHCGSAISYRAVPHKSRAMTAGADGCQDLFGLLFYWFKEVLKSAIRVAQLRWPQSCMVHWIGIVQSQIVSILTNSLLPTISRRQMFATQEHD
ncbi:MAG: hypothetical protein DCC67_16345 [Planctomycetota bacterium]|nr:MAG: hypothetical protein DCC67_16345 [Planctomycetota bacterium]